MSCREPFPFRRVWGFPDHHHSDVCQSARGDPRKKVAPTHAPHLGVCVFSSQTPECELGTHILIAPARSQHSYSPSDRCLSRDGGGGGSLALLSLFTSTTGRCHVWIGGEVRVAAPPPRPAAACCCCGCLASAAAARRAGSGDENKLVGRSSLCGRLGSHCNKRVHITRGAKGGEGGARGASC